MKAMMNRFIWDSDGLEYFLYDDNWGFLGKVITDSETAKDWPIEWVSPAQMYQNVIVPELKRKVTA